MSVPGDFHAASKELENYIIAPQYAKPYNEGVINPHMNETHTENATIIEGSNDVRRLEIPAGPAGEYRLAQLDDYANLPRNRFPWTPPISLSLQARASSAHIPGTWGFGFWNDPFSLSLGFGGGSRKLPTLPQAAWFFFASEENHLSFRDDLPANGPLAATFRSLPIPSLLLSLGIPALPFLAWSPTAKIIRKLIRPIIRQDAAPLNIAPDEWHSYSIAWGKDMVSFSVDGELVLQTSLAPTSPLGLVIWIDNQYAAFPASGQLSYGTLASAKSNWIEVKEISIFPG